jgi:alkylation response protein AidB-like acyl-CoA dehydrogenase
MDFSLTAEQQQLRDALAGYLATHYDLAAGRVGWQPEVWRAFAEDLGILGAALPENGGGPIEAMVIAEELGRALVVEPYVDTVVLAGGVLRRCPGGEQVLKGIVDGAVRVAPALDGTVTAGRAGDDWLLDGTKIVVPGLPPATHLLVSADTQVFLLPVDHPGLQVHRFRTIDDRHAADITFEQVRVPAAALLDSGAQALPEALDEATAAVCAEAVGCMRTVLADTVAYTKQRRQFGQAIGSFQVLQHRMVDMYVELEQAVSAVYLATLKLGAPADERAAAVSAAKVTVNRAARFVGQSAVQLHGGMGMTQELAIGHYFKRLTAVEYELGSTDLHRDRYARMSR